MPELLLSIAQVVRVQKLVEVSGSKLTFIGLTQLCLLTNSVPNSFQPCSLKVMDIAIIIPLLGVCPCLALSLIGELTSEFF